MIPEVNIKIGHVCSRLDELPSESHRMAVCSPPYWALRNYQTEPQTWGGKPECRHEWECHAKMHKGGKTGKSSALALREANEARDDVQEFETGQTCLKCGAWLGELGLEPTPDLFVDHLVRDVFSRLRRVLTPDGSLWVNLGDSYVADAKDRDADQLAANSKLKGGYSTQVAAKRQQSKIVPGLKPKDLALVPARFSLAMQKAGWYVRQDIIWHKPNPQPESVTDRCTRSHEHFFMFTRSKRYYYDAAAIEEKALQPQGKAKLTGQIKSAELQDLGGSTLGSNQGREMRNKRDVWSICTRPYAGSHYAVFPPELITPAIRAGSAPGDWVLDCFGGSGTTGEVGIAEGRNVTLIDLNPLNETLMRDRIAPSYGQALLC